MIARRGVRKFGRRLVAVPVVVAALLTGCTEDDSARPRPPSETRSEETIPPFTAPPPTPLTTVAGGAAATPAGPGSVVATALVNPIRVHEGPADTTPAQEMGPPRLPAAQRVFLVKELQPEWAQVFLPQRPNGSTGWVRRSDVSLGTTEYRFTIELGGPRITVRRGAEVILSEPVAVGSPAEPTPTGFFYLVALVEQRPDGPGGPFAYRLSGFSNVIQGDRGNVAIGGTNDPASLGQRVTRGAVRMSNDGIARLARMVPLGTPVEIVP